MKVSPLKKNPSQAKIQSHVINQEVPQRGSVPVQFKTKIDPVSSKLDSQLQSILSSQKPFIRLNSSKRGFLDSKETLRALISEDLIRLKNIQ